MVTNTGEGRASDGSDELWTPGEAAAYLNAGGIKLGITPRQVSRMIGSGVLAGTQGPPGTWRRTLASAVRRMRAERLRDLDLIDPDYELPPESDSQ